MDGQGLCNTFLVSGTQVFQLCRYRCIGRVALNTRVSEVSITVVMCSRISELAAEFKRIFAISSRERLLILDWMDGSFIVVDADSN